MEQNDAKNQETESTTQQAGSGNGADTAETAAAQTAPKNDAEAAQKELLYLKAEFDNFRKRVLRDQETAIRFANEKLLGELLSVVDLFDRAMSSAKPLQSKLEGNPAANEVKNFILGIEMTHREMTNLLGRFGVELTGAAGEAFDPNRHEAITEMETSAENAGKILEVLQKGCLFQGRLLKPARVVVGKAQS